MNPHAPLGRRRGPVSVRAARILYNVADAWLGGDQAVDVLPGVEDRIRWRGTPAARRTWLLLMTIEWAPLLTLRSLRAFSRLPRARRRALLDALERSRLPGRRRALADLRSWVEEAAAQSSGA